MTFKASRWLLSLAILLSALCLSFASAEARGRSHRPNHHHHRYSNIHHHHRRVAHHAHRRVHHAYRGHEYQARAGNRHRGLSISSLSSYPTIAHASGGSLLALAERYVGSRNPTGFHGPWCGAFMGLVARRAGLSVPEGYLQARQWARVGHRVAGPQIGAIAVMAHHVGIVAGMDARGNPVLVSGNYGGRVGVGAHSARGIIAYVRPG